MKTINLKKVMSTLGVLILTLAAGVFVYGIGDLQIYPLEGSKKARINVSVPANMDVKLSVHNIDGTGVYYETISEGTTYHKLFDFTNLENGVYKLVTISGNKVVINEIQINESEIKLNKSEVEYKPGFRLDKRTLMVDYLNTDAHEISLTISENGHEFFEDENTEKIPFRKAYDLNNLAAGHYNACLTAGNKSYNYYFEVD